MKRILTTGTIAFAIIFYAASAFSQKTETTKPPKKERHIKLEKIVDGKKMSLDTVVTGTDILVWQGDTVYPLKPDKEFVVGKGDKLFRYDVRIDDKDGKKNVMVFSSDEKKGTEPFIWHMDSDAEDVLSMVHGDSITHKIIIHKKIKDGDEEQIFSFDGPDLKHFAPPVPPMPPVPPIPHIKMLKHFSDGRVIDLNDPDIISYKKKDMSGGREKIEIIRKKSDKKDMTFEFKDGSKWVTPGFEGDASGVKQMKIVEKKVKVDGKDGKKVEVNVETDDNK